MGRLVLAIDPAVQVSAAELAAGWNGDHEARAAGLAEVEAGTPSDFFGGMDLVVIPAGVGLAVNAITALAGRLVSLLREDKEEPPELEIAELSTRDGDRVVVVRLRGARR